MTPIALVCLGDSACSGSVCTALERRGWPAQACPDPVDATALLASGDVGLAIVDWRGHHSTELLRKLHRDRTIATFVFDEISRELTHGVGRPYPEFFFIDRAWGVGELVSKVVELTNRRLGDLELRDGLVIHAPTGDEVKGVAAPKLMLASPKAVHLEKMQAFRVRRSLEQRGSIVEVQGGKEGLYWLAVRSRAA